MANKLGSNGVMKLGAWLTFYQWPVQCNCE